jgi:hypothetical protein
MNLQSHIRHIPIARCALIGIFAAAYICLYILYPWSFDDVWYSFYLHDYLEGIDRSFPWDAIRQTISYHYANDNARLGNMILPLLLILPRWIGGTVFGIITAAIAAYIPRFAPRHSNSTILLLLSMFLVTFALPWHETMVTLTFAINYLPPTLLSLIILNRWIRPDRRISYWTIPLCIILGFWHEGFCVPMGVGMGLSMLCCNKWSWSRVLAIAALLPGFAFLLSSPGVFRYTDGTILGGIVSATVTVLKQHSPLLIFTALYLVSAIARHRTGNKIATSEKMLVICIFAAAAVAIMLNIMVCFMVRASFVAFVMAIIGLVYLAGLHLNDRWLETPRGYVLSGVLAATMAIHIVYLIVLLIPFRQSYYETLDQIRHSPTGTFFADNACIDLSIPTWRKLPYSAWIFENTENLESYFTRDKSTNKLQVIPSELKSADAADYPTIAGDTDIHVKDGLLFRRVAPTNTNDIVIYYGPMRRPFYMTYAVHPYRNDKNEEYEWLVLANPSFPVFLFDIKAIYRND